MNKVYIILAIIVILIVLIFAGVRIFGNKENTKTTVNNINAQTENNNKSAEENSEIYLTGKHNIEIVVKNYGTIAVELDADVAPITVTNFINLVKEGFYNGLTFHRIIDGFMIQGGDPLANGTGGSDKQIKGEFALNGVKNTISHKRGVISMARSQLSNSARSQFFICHKDSTYLDGQYAAFGHTTSGMEIVDKICQNVQVEDNNGTVLKQNQPVIEKIIVVE